MTQDTAVFSFEECIERRLIREGACPILEIRVAYPRTVCADTTEEEASSAVNRFNEAYRAMAENFLRWAQGAPAATAREDFLAAGVGAAYRFDRRVVACDMVAAYVQTEQGAPPTSLTVTRTVRVGSRRGEMPEKSLTAVDVWRLPELTLCPSRRTRGKVKEGTLPARG